MVRSDSKTNRTRGESPLKILSSDLLGGNKDNSFCYLEFKLIKKQKLGRENIVYGLSRLPDIYKYITESGLLLFPFMSVGIDMKEKESWNAASGMDQ